MNRGMIGVGFKKLARTPVPKLPSSYPPIGWVKLLFVGFSVYMCFVVTCWERADLLALGCGVFCEFVTFPLVSWVRCGT